MAKTEKTISIWDKVWSKNDLPEWDYLSQVIFRTLKNEMGDLKKGKILEAGSGSGRISLKLAKEKSKVNLLDNSLEALNFSKKIFKNANERLNTICASIFQIAYLDNTFDVIWNAGVVEHFEGQEQNIILKEMVRVCKKGGIIITLNPCAKCILHNIGKFIIERLVEYPYGEEFPIHTLSDKVSTLNCKLKKEEYSIGFILLFVGMFKRLTLLPMGNIFKPALFFLNKACCYLDASPLGNILQKIDLYLSKIFGGYLLVSVLEKQ